jgi:hypothetical protein
VKRSNLNHRPLSVNQDGGGKIPLAGVVCAFMFVRRTSCMAARAKGLSSGPGELRLRHPAAGAIINLAFYTARA